MLADDFLGSGIQFSRGDAGLDQLHAQPARASALMRPACAHHGNFVRAFEHDVAFPAHALPC